MVLSLYIRLWLYLGYEEPKYDDEYGYEEPKYDHRRMYKLKTMKSHYGYGGDSYGKSFSTGTYEPSSYRHKRSADSGARVGQMVGPDGVKREGQGNQGRICESKIKNVCQIPFK